MRPIAPTVPIGLLQQMGLFCDHQGMADTREPRAGERCAACGKPAKIVYRKLLGDVPTCELPKPIEGPTPRPQLQLGQ